MAAPAPVPSASVTVNAGEAVVSERKVLADGHVDIGPRLRDGSFKVLLRDDTVRPAVWRDLADVVLHVKEQAKLTVPADPAYGFLGAAGTQIWVLPQVQQQGVLWPGWNTSDPDVAGALERDLTFTLHGVTGPGKFVLFVNGEFGAPQTLFDSSRPVPQQTGVELATHVHGNWSFTAPGGYVLDLEMSGRNRSGQAVSDRRSLRVYAGSGDPASAFALAAPVAPASASRPEPESRNMLWLAALIPALITVVGIGAVWWRRRRSADA